MIGIACRAEVEAHPLIDRSLVLMGAAPMEATLSVETYFAAPTGDVCLTQAAMPGEDIASGRTHLMATVGRPLPDDERFVALQISRTPVKDAIALRRVLALSLGMVAVLNVERTMFRYLDTDIVLESVANVGNFVVLRAMHGVVESADSIQGIVPPDEPPLEREQIRRWLNQMQALWDVLGMSDAPRPMSLVECWRKTIR